MILRFKVPYEKLFHTVVLLSDTVRMIFSFFFLSPRIRSTLRMLLSLSEHPATLRTFLLNRTGGIVYKETAPSSFRGTSVLKDHDNFSGKSWPLPSRATLILSHLWSLKSTPNTLASLECRLGYGNGPAPLVKAGTLKSQWVSALRSRPSSTKDAVVRGCVGHFSRITHDDLLWG